MIQKIKYPIRASENPEVKENILVTLAYFDLFNYPLTRAEIFLFLQINCDPCSLDDALECLLLKGSIFLFDTFYTLQNDHYLIVRRLVGNSKADELLKTATRIGKLLILFPYVRGIAISGSLSKNFADEKSDIDLFIITETNRLWIARTLMHCFKKLTYLLNKEHLFCMNYYIDMQQLEIPEKNIYTAIEVSTLIPLQGDIVFEQFYAENSWTRDFLPNKTLRISSAMPLKNATLKRIFERIFNFPFGQLIENKLMQITAKRWLKKKLLKRLNNHGDVLSLLTNNHYAKPDPCNFQNKLLSSYEKKVHDLLTKYEGSFTS